MSRRRGCSGILLVFLGIVIGFFLTFGVIGGFAYYAYASVNLKTVENTFGLDLSDVPEDLKNKSIKQLIPMVGEVGQLSVDEFCVKYDIAFPKKVEVGTDEETGEKLYIDLTEALQPILKAKVVDAFGKINEVIDYFTVSNSFALLGQVNELPDFNFLHDAKYKDIPVLEMLSKIDELTVKDVMESTADLNSGALKYVKDMKVVDLAKEDGLNDAINKMTIGEILGTTETTGIMGALAGLKVGELNDDKIVSAIGDLTLKEVLKISDSATGIIAEVKDLTINQIKNGEIDDKVKQMKLGEVMDITETSGIMFELKDVVIGDLTSEYILNNINIGTALGVDATTGILGTIKGWKLSELTEQNLRSLKVGAVLNIAEDATGILGAIKDLSIGDLNSESDVQNAIKALKIVDILDISGESKIFNAIKDLELQNLDDYSIKEKIGGLLVGDIVDYDNTNSNKIWSIIAGTRIDAIGQRINDLKVSELIDFNYDSDGDGVNDSYTGFLSFLIDPANGKDPKVTELSSALDSATDDYIKDYFNTKTVGDLVDDGILTGVDKTSPKYAEIRGKNAKQFIEELINSYMQA